jgi:ADP-ribose pyrophosphatase YjhB (NUDIX family)
MVEFFRYCPNCRAELGPYQDYKRVCPECGREHYENVAATACLLILDENDRVLLARRSVEPYKGTYDIPGGFAEPLETVRECVLREVKEETGLTSIDILDYLGSFPDRYGETGEYTLNIVYVGRLRSGQPKANDDISTIAWYDLDKLPNVDDGPPNTRHALEALIEWHKRKLSL